MTWGKSLRKPRRLSQPSGSFSTGTEPNRTGGRQNSSWAGSASARSSLSSPSGGATKSPSTGPAAIPAASYSAAWACAAAGLSTTS